MTCLPTAGENFGHVIAESLSQSCPVMIMDVTPWTAVVAGGGGIIVPSGTVEAWKHALQTVLNGDETFEQRRRDAARAYNTWRGSAETGSFLDQLLDGGYEESIRSGQSK